MFPTGVRGSAGDVRDDCGQRPGADHHHDSRSVWLAAIVPRVVAGVVCRSAFAIVSRIWNGVRCHFPGEMIHLFVFNFCISETTISNDML